MLGLYLSGGAQGPHGENTVSRHTVLDGLVPFMDKRCESVQQLSILIGSSLGLHLSVSCACTCVFESPGR